MTDKAYPEPSPLMRAFKAFMDDYELRGEDDDGREGCYRPNETERLLIEDFVWGLMEDDDWIAASRPAAGSGISDAQIDVLIDEFFGKSFQTGAMRDAYRDFARKTLAMAPATTQPDMGAKLANGEVAWPFSAEATTQAQEAGSLEPTWIVNDLGELGVKVGERLFFLYKGDNIEYGASPDNAANGVALHDDGTSMRYRIVGKREFGEVCRPLKWIQHGRCDERYTEKLNFTPGLSFGKPEDGEWRDLPAAPTQADSAPGDEAQLLAWIDSHLRGLVPLIRIQLMERGQYRLVDSIDALRAAQGQDKKS